MNSGNKRPVSVDDLLRLKRVERPPQEFWAEFDRQLRAKQLAALVERRPWWRAMPSFAAFWPRVRVPLGVATVAVIGVLSVRTDRVLIESPGPSISEVSPALNDVPALASASVTIPVAPALESLATEPASALLQVVEQPAKATADIVVQPAHPIAVASAPAVPSQPTLDRAAVAPMIVANVVAENRPAASPSRAPIDPLQQMTPPGESRRVRFLTAMVSTAAVETSARISERAASRFAEDRLQDQAGRFGARGDRVNLKF